MRALARRLGWGRMLLALVGGLVLNLAVLCAAPLLRDSTGHRAPYDRPPVPLFLPAPKPPPPPPPEEPPEPEPPKPLPKLQALKPLAPARPRPAAQVPSLGLQLNTGLASGPALGPPGPLRLEMGQVDRAPLATVRIPPIYPYQARRRGVEGWVAVRFLVDTQGRVRHLQITRAQPPGVFESAVRRALAQWRFRPGVKDGRPVETWVSTTIRFRLDQ